MKSLKRGSLWVAAVTAFVLAAGRAMLAETATPNSTTSSSGGPSVAFSFIAAVVGWLVLEFVGRPFRKFFDLRGEVIYLLTLTANVRAQYKVLRDLPDALEPLDLTEDEVKVLRQTERSFRDIAARMVAFSARDTRTSASPSAWL